MKLVKSKRYAELLAKEKELIRRERDLKYAEDELCQWRKAAHGECVADGHCRACKHYVVVQRIGYLNGTMISDGVCDFCVPCPKYERKGDTDNEQ